MYKLVTCWGILFPQIGIALFKSEDLFQLFSIHVLQDATAEEEGEFDEEEEEGEMA